MTLAPHGSSERVVIAGGSGFLGQSLARHLSAQGYNVVCLGRSASPSPDAPWIYDRWDARSLGVWMRYLDGARAVINLAGRTVDCIKTPDHRDEILRSRVDSVRVLGEALAAVHAPPPVWVQMSTAHIHGDPPSVVCDERSPTGLGLAPGVGRAWEAAFHDAKPPHIRGVLLRTSFVIGRPNPGGTGALGKLGLLSRLGLGGRVGSGTQGMSWIHEADLNRIFEHAIRNDTVHGVYIASAPHPVPQHEFMRELRRVAGGLGSLGLGLPAPALMVRFGASLILRTDPELALYGRYVVPRRLLDEGFVFTFPHLREALVDLYSRPPASSAPAPGQPRPAADTIASAR